MGSKVKKWISEVTLLAEFATSELQACYAAFTFGLRHKWTYFMRTCQRAISDVLLPSLTEHHCSVAETKTAVALPDRLGGLGMTNPPESAESEYSASIRISASLLDKIMVQSQETPDDADVRRLMHAAREERDDDLKGKLEELKVGL